MGIQLWQAGIRATIYSPPLKSRAVSRRRKIIVSLEGTLYLVTPKCEGSYINITWELIQNADLGSHFKHNKNLQRSCEIWKFPGSSYE